MKLKRRVLVVDDHPVMRLGYIEAFNREADFEVCGEAGTAAETLSALARLKPDLLVLDLNLPDREGLEFIKDLHALDPHLPVLVVSMADETLFARRVLQAGGRGYVMKSEGPYKLVSAARTVLGGKPVLSSAMTARLLQGLIPGSPSVTGSEEKLTDREHEILHLLGSGWNTAEIAQRLGISAKTVAVHRVHIREKLGFNATSELLRFAIKSASGEKPPRNEA